MFITSKDEGKLKWSSVAGCYLQCKAKRHCLNLQVVNLKYVYVH